MWLGVNVLGIKSLLGIVSRKNICLSDTSKVMIVTNVYLLWGDVLMGTGGMSHFVNLPSLRVLGFCSLLMRGDLLKETFWVVSIRLELCILFAHSCTQ
jgi:hypothetical protein